MTEHSPSFGYGWAAAALEASWRELDADLPVKGPDCPLTADLLNLALGLAEPRTEAQLRHHVNRCGYCEARFQAQMRAVAETEAQRQPVAGPALLEQMQEDFAHWQRGLRIGTIEQLLPAAASECAVLSMLVHLAPPQGLSGGPLTALLEWSRTTTPDTTAGPQPWSVEMRLPSQRSDATRGNADADLETLADCAVTFQLQPMSPGPGCEFRTQLHWNPARTDLVSSHPSTLRLDDPTQLRVVSLVPPTPLSGYDLS